MTTKPPTIRDARPRRSADPARTSTRSGAVTRRRVVVAAAIAALVVAGLFAVFAFNGANQGNDGEYPYAVGSPGPGEEAPPLRLPSTAGGEFDLADARGERVMLYFQEGVMCQPCWDQLRDIEAGWDGFAALGIDRIVSITSDPLDVLRTKVELEQLDSAVLSDPGVAVSQTWEANLYGMMGTSMNGHSFVVVGPDGTIEWRADYGGAPNHFMYVPVDRLLADMAEGLSSDATTG